MIDSPVGTHKAFVAKTRSGAQDVYISAVPLAEVDILQPSASQLESGVTLVLVPDPAQAVQEASFLDTNPLSSELIETASDTRCVIQLCLCLTGAGHLFRDSHDRRGHAHDHALKQMVVSKQSGCDHLSWVPGLHIRDYCWAC